MARKRFSGPLPQVEQWESHTLHNLRKPWMKQKLKKELLPPLENILTQLRHDQKKHGIELIPRNFPSFNIFEHDFVSKHELLTSEEKQKFLDDRKVESYQLPRINATDPAIIAVGGRPGDIVRVIRKSQTAGKYVTYRYIV